jgi:hypothetical protein
MASAETIAKALCGRKAGSGWAARCPAHDDREPSLSIRDGDNGKVLIRCHAGCDQGRVIAALRSRGLWDERGQRQHWLWRTDRLLLGRVGRQEWSPVAPEQAADAVASPSTEAPSVAPTENQTKFQLVRHAPSKSCQRGVRVWAARSGGCYGR